MALTPSRPIPVLICPDVREAVAWLGAAFGFVERVRIGEDHRAQLGFGDGAVIIADVGHDRRPLRPGEVTHSVTVRVADVGAHYQRSRGHGARIVMEPTDFEYGEQQHTAEDFAGRAPVKSWQCPTRVDRVQKRRGSKAGMTDSEDLRGSYAMVICLR